MTALPDPTPGSRSRDCVIIGGGPAGLTAAYEATKFGIGAIVLEADDELGGISRTASCKGYRFDLGGHRFFTKVEYVQQLWEEILGDEFLTRPRLSRIHYNGKLFDYPLKPLNALRSLGVIESFRVAASYAYSMAFPHREERTFEQWVSNRFGRRLFEIFFKTYTEKVWGMPCSEISAEWAGQRIKNLDLRSAVMNALLGKSGKSKDAQITTLIDQFHYPRYGPGQMWDRCAEQLRARGQEVRLGARVTKIRHDGERVTSVALAGEQEEVHGEHFISSAPIRTLVRMMDPPPPEAVLEAANSLRYRDFLIVALIIDREDLFPDNWIYIHSAEVRVGRIQNFKNWSPDMVPDQSKTSLGLEYFVQEGDDLWSMEDAGLIELASDECARLGLAPRDAVLDGTVVRVPKAYPVYDDVYKQALATIRGWLDGITNLQLVGRNGQHRYNNQDHSMMTAVLAARNIAGERNDVWSVNVEQDYHEEAKRNQSSGDRQVPGKVPTTPLEDAIDAAFARFDAVALGVAVGTVMAVGLFLATAILIVQGNEPVGPTLSLLGAYFFGYSVTWPGAFVGMVEAGLFGFVFGWLLAQLISATIGREESKLRRRIEIAAALNAIEGEES